MYGHAIAAFCTSGDLILSDCMSHETIRKIKVDHLNPNLVTKMLFFKNSPQDKNFMIAFVENIADN